jgi:hypothetical protein
MICSLSLRITPTNGACCASDSLGRIRFLTIRVQQLFRYLPDSIIERLKEYYEFYLLVESGRKPFLILLVTSWLRQRVVEEFARMLKALSSI